MKPITGTNPLSPSVTEVGSCSECPMPAAEVAETTASIATIESDVCNALESFSSITYTTNLRQGFTTGTCTFHAPYFDKKSVNPLLSFKTSVLSTQAPFNEKCCPEFTCTQNPDAIWKPISTM